MLSDSIAYIELYYHNLFLFLFYVQIMNVLIAEVIKDTHLKNDVYIKIVPNVQVIDAFDTCHKLGQISI